jgi:serine/threonine protein kinase
MNTMNDVDPEVDKTSAEREAKELGVTVEGPLSEGPMTSKWRARTEDGREVALVVLGKATPEERDRFRRTAQDLKASDNAFPRILRVHEVSPSGEAIVTDLWSGGTARDLGELPAGERLKFGRRVVDALAALHKAGFVHGALSPENVLLDGEREPILGELGTISRQKPYAAPEVCKGEVPTTRSDVFSAGSVLLELLGDDKTPALEEVLTKSISPLALVRHADASELGRAIAAAVVGSPDPSQDAPAGPAPTNRSDLVQARPPPSVAKPRPAPASRSGKVTRTQVLLGLLGVVLVLAVLTFIFGGPPKDGEGPAIDLGPPASSK